jgi:hypothetical protein
VLVFWYGVGFLRILVIPLQTGVGLLLRRLGAALVSLLLAALRYGVSPTGFVWLSIPKVNNRLDWHP